MMQALRQFSEQLGLFLDGFGDCHGWVPSVSVRIAAPAVSYLYARWIPSPGARSRSHSENRRKVNDLSLPLSQIGQTFFAECGDHRGLLSHLSKCSKRGPERRLLDHLVGARERRELRSRDEQRAAARLFDAVCVPLFSQHEPQLAS